MAKKRHLSLEYTPDEGDLNAPVEPLTFDLREQTFTCVDEIPAAVVLKIGIAQDPEAENWEQLKAVKQFFDTITIAADRQRFSRLLENATPVIGIEELIGYMNDLAEAVSDRPTEGPQDSPTSLSDTPLSSTENSSTEATGAASTI